MKAFPFIKRHIVGIVTLVAVFLGVRYVVVNYRPPGSMTVIEAQAMDMSQSGTPLGSIPVATEKITRRLFAPTVTYTGSVAAYNDAEVYPRVAGTLLALTVYPGDRVRAGQVVARLDSAELASREQEAAANRMAAQHDFRSSQSELEQAVAQKRVAQAKVAGLRSAQQDAQAQLTAAQAMREQASREQEAAQAGLTDAESNVSAAQADLDYWTAEIAREEKLFQAGAVSREEYDREKALALQAHAKRTQALAAVREKRAMLAAAQSKIRQAEAGIASAQARLDQARAELQGATAEIAAADANIELTAHHTAHRNAMMRQAVAQERTADIVRGYTEIRAAQDGVVTERLVSPGTLVQPGMALLKIKSLDRVRLQASVAETDLAGIRVGNYVTVTAPRDPNLHLRTRVTSLFNAADPQTRTVTVEALTPNPGGRLLPGQYIVMEIATAAPREVVTVPVEAVQRDGEQQPFVWTVAAGQQGGKTIYACVMHPEVQSDKPGKCYKCGMDLEPTKKGGKQIAHRVDIALGPSDGKRVVVEQGLQEGDEVITRGQENLNEGDPVTPTEWGIVGPKELPAPSPDGPHPQPRSRAAGEGRGEDSPSLRRRGPGGGSSSSGGMENMPGMGGR
jgi:RND family efflux transporter MFP subunit